MNGMAKPTTFSKEESFGTVPPSLGLHTHRQRGRSAFRRASRGLRGALSAKTPTPTSSR